ncbi:multidrug resistance protein [Senna tora]|uniref:Multidrug resistance protein n=1 Tax=Senna tora TaxID=362788 RepID=A0A834XGF4_9FABA|nr:multidrug resistance protein [Senna tora]
MSDFNNERSKPWNIYTTSEPGPPQAGIDKEAPWKSFGTSMNAISFGFVATAILISMFLIMAIFEHLFKPSSQFSSSEHLLDSLESGTTGKHGNRQTFMICYCFLQVAASYASDFSVLMPGQQFPTYIAQPAPLPCSREGIHWPSHEHSFVFD